MDALSVVVNVSALLALSVALGGHQLFFNFCMRVLYEECDRCCKQMGKQPCRVYAVDSSRCAAGHNVADSAGGGKPQRLFGRGSEGGQFREVGEQPSKGFPCGLAECHDPKRNSEDRHRRRSGKTEVCQLHEPVSAVPCAGRSEFADTAARDPGAEYPARRVDDAVERQFPEAVGRHVGSLD